MEALRFAVDGALWLIEAPFLAISGALQLVAVFMCLVKRPPAGGSASPPSVDTLQLMEALLLAIDGTLQLVTTLLCLVMTPSS